MTRRDLMRWLLAAPIGGALIGGSPSEAWAEEESVRAGLSALRPEILEVIGDRKKAKAIAEAYRRARPEESLEEIERAVRSAAAPRARSGRVRAEAVRRLVRREYAQGRTLELDGWILAETEARQCVLYETARPSSA